MLFGIINENPREGKGSARKERIEYFGGYKYMRVHTLRSLKSARSKSKELSLKGLSIKVERERGGLYNLYKRI